MVSPQHSGSGTSNGGAIRFGEFEYEPRRRELRKHGLRIRLQNQPLAILLALTESPGAIVSREELRTRIWGSNTFVEFEQGLNSAIRRLRDALCDSANDPRYIETVPGEGYRFIGQVERVTPVDGATLAGPGNAGAIPVAVTTPLHWSKKLVWVAGGLAVGALTYFLSTMAILSHSRVRAAPKIRSLFVVLTEKPNQDLESQILTESAAESVINTLRRVPNLKVIAEHSPVTRQEALSTGRTLKCDGVLFVQGERTGDRFRIQVETSESSSGMSLWEEAFVVRLSDAVWVDTSAGELIARRFRLNDTHAQQKQPNSDAFQEYVRGRFFWNKRTPRDLQEAFHSFKAAIRDDPGFTAAYAGLAQTYAVAELHDPAYRNDEEFIRDATDAAKHAILMDPSSASAHAAYAQILRNFDRDMIAAEREYLQAIELDPNDATAHQWYAEFLGIDGRFDEAIAQIDRAHELDPLSAVITAVCGTIRIEARRYEESLPFAEEALRLDPQYYSVYDGIAAAMEGSGRFQEAFDARTRQADVMQSPSMDAIAREDRAAFAGGGRRALIQQRLRRLLAVNSPAHPQFYGISKLYCQLGDVARCLSALETAVAERGEGTIDVKIDPSFDIIRDNPRYAALIIKFGFKPAIS